MLAIYKDPPEILCRNTLVHHYSHSKLFVMDTNNVADAPTHNVGQQYTYSVKGFTYMKDWAFLVFETNGKNEKCIIGNKSDYPMSEMIILKGMSVEVTYRGTKTINDNTYNQFSLDCIAF